MTGIKKIANRRIICPLALVLLALILAGCQGGKVLGEETADANAGAEVPAGQVAIIDNNIIVSRPMQNDIISSPLDFSGRALLNAGKVLIRLVDNWNNVMATSSVAVSAQDAEWGTFGGRIEFPVSFSQNGWFEAYSQDAQDGTIQNLMRVPIVFKDYKEPVVTIFFSNVLQDPELKNCGKVYPVQRKIVPSDKIAGAVLAELLGGVNEEEAKAGYVNNIPEEGIKVQNLEFKDGKLSIDFNPVLQKDVKGACRVAAIRAQITETLKQFQGVKEVVISIDGKTDGILKP